MEDSIIGQENTVKVANKALSQLMCHDDTRLNFQLLHELTNGSFDRVYGDVRNDGTKTVSRYTAIEWLDYLSTDASSGLSIKSS